MSSDKINKIAAKVLRATPNGLLRTIFRPTKNKLGNELASDAKVTLWFLSKTSKDFSDFDIKGAREIMDAEADAGAGPSIEVGHVEDLTLNGVHARYYRPKGVSLEEKLPCLIYIHGGGWVLCSIDSHDNTARFFTENSKVAVINVNYSLAPEHKFPQGLQDINQVFEALLEGQVYGIDKSRIAVGGDSAGGNLSASLCLYRAKENLEQPKLQMLFVPVTDLSKMETSSYKEFEDGFYLTKKQMIWYKRHYLEKEEDAYNYLVSPLLAPKDLISKTAPAYVSVSGFDPLRDEGIAYAERLEDAGVKTHLRVNHTLIHPFTNTFYIWKDAKTTMDHAAKYLKENI